MDLATVIGLIVGFANIILGIIFAKGNPLLFFDIPSVFITVGGSFCALLISNPLSKVLSIWKVAKHAFFPPKYNPNELILTLVSFSEKARREGLLALEDDLDELDDQFLRKGIQLVVDGTDPELVRRIMETELENMQARHDEGKKLFDDWATYAPAFGMIGTLLGLVLMLVNIEDKSAIGPGMSAALITTFYGAIMAYLVLYPISAKLGYLNNQEVLMRLIMIEGTLSIQSGDNPRIVKDKLISFLDPKMREAITSEVGD